MSEAPSRTSALPQTMVLLRLALSPITTWSIRMQLVSLTLEPMRQCGPMLDFLMAVRPPTWGACMHAGGGVSAGGGRRV